MIDRDLHYENELKLFNKFGYELLNYNLRTSTGHVPNKYSVGPALLWSPFFGLAHFSTYVLNLFGVPLALDGYTVLYQFFICLGSIFYGFLGLLFLYKINRLFFDDDVSVISVITILLSTNLLNYFMSEQTMPHIISMSSVALFAYLSLRDYGKKKTKSYVYLGLTAGLMIMVRYQNALFMILTLIELMTVSFGRGRSRGDILIPVRNGALFLLVVVLALIPQFIVWKVIYGEFIVYTYPGEGFHFLAPKLLETLFSSRHGLIRWTPIIAFALGGYILYFRKAGSIFFALLICFLLQWYVNASWHCWWFGNSFGGRAFINCTFIFTIGLSALITRFYEKRIYLFAIFTALVAWNFVFTAQYIVGLIPQGDHVTWKTVARNSTKLIDAFVGRVR
ncbi:MAG: glycosyltransferase family 39 protein [Deltaproteobacteria bacterium]|nr:glycosyltransferase family 39 protein [Deltaproteobacteria bacterium]